MGMYDNIEDIQVKCFDVPYFVKNDIIINKGICYSGGELRIFNKGDEVPYKTLWYDYTPNFGILNHYFQFGKPDTFDIDDEGLIIIKNGKVKKIIYGFNKVKDSDLKGLNMIIDHYGSRINIKEVEDIEKMREDFYTYRKVYDDLNEKSTKTLGEWTHLTRMKNGVSPLDEGLTMDDVIRELELIPDRYEKEKKLVENDIERLRKTYIDDWYVKDDKEILYTLGAAIDCRDNLYDRATKKLSRSASEIEINLKKDAEESFYEVLGLIKEITSNKDIVDKFFKWQGFDEVKENEIKDLFKRIEDGKEKL